MTACEESTTRVRAPIRCAITRSACGGMARSSLATTYQDGIVFQAGEPTSSAPRADNAAGRWVAAITAA